MTLISDLSIYTNDANLVPNITTISATEHNTHRTNVRDLLQDFIDVVGDLQNCYSSASEPTDKPDGKDWFDSSNSVKKTRIGSAWYTIVTTTQTQTLTNKTLTSPTIGSGLTLSGDITATSAALDFDLVDNNASALSFDATGKTGILEIITTDSAEGVAFSGFIRAQNTGLKIYDSGSDHLYTIAIGTNATANRTLTFTPGDADRTITLSGNPTLSDWFDQSVKQAASPTFATLTVSGILTVTSLTVSGDITADTSTFKVDSANNRVGVGTTTPGYALHVAGETSVNKLRVNDGESSRYAAFIHAIGGTPYGRSGSNGGTGARQFKITGFTQQTDSTGSLETDVIDFDGAHLLLLKDQKGNVGIGTTTPGYALHVAGETSVNKLRVTDGDSSRYAAFIQAIGGTPYGRSGSNGGTGARQFKITGFTQQPDNSGSQETDVIDFDGAHLIFLKDQKGNVGIGTTTPQYSLHVAGSGGFTSMTLDQGTDDGKIFQLRSTGDVNHAMTAAAGATTYLYMEKNSATAGGALIRGLTTGKTGLNISPFVTTEDTSRNSSTIGALRISCNKDNGSGTGGAMSSSAAMVTIDTNGTSKLVLDASGGLYVTAGAIGALDDEEDIDLVRLAQRSIHHDLGIAMSQWDHHIKANFKDLQRVGVFGEDGKLFSVNRMLDLHGGAIWKNHVNHQDHCKRQDLMNQAILDVLIMIANKTGLSDQVHQRLTLK